MFENPSERAPQVVTGRVTRTPWYVVPGIVAAAAYATGEAMGQPFDIDMGSRSGLIIGALVLDYDLEQLAFDIVLFESRIKPTADNAAFVLVDSDAPSVVGHIPVSSADFAAFSASAIATVRIAPLGYVAPQRRLIAQCVTRGVPNYTAATDLAIRLILIPDLA